MLLNHVFLAGVWIVYCGLHSVLASISVKQWVQQNTGTGFRYYRLFYTLFAFLSLVAVIYIQLSIQSIYLYEQNPFSYAVGGIIAAAGLSLMMVCIKKYFLSLSGLKSLYQESPSSELMIAGVHRYMRHPLYTGTFLFIWGLWVMFPSLSLRVMDTVITVYTVYAIRLEETKLVQEFGDKYREYQRTVPKLIPRL
jgi:protein-S-isoprenylcysteine O-methyltransferase Ste14